MILTVCLFCGGAKQFAAFRSRVSENSQLAFQQR